METNEKTVKIEIIPIFDSDIASLTQKVEKEIDYRPAATN